MTKTNKKPDPTVETKSLSIEVKAEAEGIITAYAAAFGTVDGYGDVINKGAFLKTIAERGPTGSKKIKVLYNHDTWEHLPIGVPLALSEDSYGLMTSTKMSRTQLGQDVYTLAEEGALSEMSIGYRAIKAEYPEDEYSRGVYRYLNEVMLAEYSVVPFPAHEGAIITGVKSGADLEREVRRWKAIYEVGLSSKAGRVLSAANAKKILTALSELQDLVAAAGLDEEEAAEGTSDSSTSTDAPKSSAEPHEHSPLLSALQLEAKRLDTEGKKSTLLTDLRSFGRSLGGTS